MEIFIGKIVSFLLFLFCFGKVLGFCVLRKNLPKSNWKDRQMLILYMVGWCLLGLLILGLFVYLHYF